MTPSQLHGEILSILKDASVDNSSQESLWITAKAAGITVSDISFSEKVLSGEEAGSGLDMASRRAAGEPVQYILGSEFFGDMEFEVGPGVLIPRPETWGLVELSLAVLPAGGTFCELGTGSGAVALTVAMKRPDATVYASELSPYAMEWARRNLRKFELENVILREGSLFEPFGCTVFDAVAANLPYIPFTEKENLQREVRDFEPASSLFAPEKGLAVINDALAVLDSHLAENGHAFFEAGSEQLPFLEKTAADSNIFSRTAVANDLYGRPRFLCLEK